MTRYEWLDYYEDDGGKTLWLVGEDRNPAWECFDANSNFYSDEPVSRDEWEKGIDMLEKTIQET